jgi:hypothetical protein
MIENQDINMDHIPGNLMVIMNILGKAISIGIIRTNLPK